MIDKSLFSITIPFFKKKMFNFNLYHFLINKIILLKEKKIPIL